MIAYENLFYKEPVKTFLHTRLNSDSRGTSERILKRVSTTLLTLEPNFDWRLINYRHLILLKSQLRKELLAPATINSYISVCKAVAREAWRQELITTNDWMRICDVKQERGFRFRHGRALSVSEIHNLINFCKSQRTARGHRDAAIIALMYGAGLRRAETVTVKVSDYSGDLLRIIGKNDKERLTPVPEFSARIVQTWLNRYQPARNAPLFCTIYGKNRITGEPMSKPSIPDLMKRLYLDTKLPRFSAHDLRRSYATHLLKAGVDVALTQKLMGHSNIATTASYDMRSLDEIKKAASMLPF